MALKSFSGSNICSFLLLPAFTHSTEHTHALTHTLHNQIYMLWTWTLYRQRCRWSAAVASAQAEAVSIKCGCCQQWWIILNRYDVWIRQVFQSLMPSNRPSRHCIFAISCRQNHWSIGRVCEWKHSYIFSTQCLNAFETNKPCEHKSQSFLQFSSCWETSLVVYFRFCRNKITESYKY